MKTRIKICGITRLEDALTAYDLGIDALGFVFYEKSSRYIDFDSAKLILDKIPPFILKVGLFVNAKDSYIMTALNKIPLNLLQFHGDETASFCESWPIPYIKAIRVLKETDVTRGIQDHPNACGYILDTYSSKGCGGTGLCFDWSLVPNEVSRAKIILAGGLNEDNVADAISIVKPFAVDVSGGVEVEKGIKDKSKIFNFIKATQNNIIQ